MSAPVRPAARLATLSLVLLAAAACGETESSGGAAVAAADRPAADIQVIDVQPGPKDDPQVAVGLCAAKAAAAKAGVKFSSVQANTFDPSAQLPLLNAAIARRPDLIILGLSDPKAFIPTIKQAQAQGIKVITVAQKAAEPVADASVLADNASAGTASATALVRLVGARGKIAMIGFKRGGSSITDARQNAVEAALKKTEVDYLGMTEPDFSVSDAAAKTGAVLAAHPDIDGILASYGYPAEGAVAALRERGMAGKVRVVGFEAQEGELKSLRAGEISALYVQPLKSVSERAVELGVELVRGRSVPKETVLPLREVTARTVDDPAVTAEFPRSSC